MAEPKRQIGGALVCPVVSCWIFFIMHFAFIGVFHGLMQLYINIYDIIIDVVLLFSMEAIAVLLTLSNNRNNYSLFNISLIVSIINLLVVLFSIFIYTFSFFAKNILTGFINAEDWLKTKGDWWVGALLIGLKVLEIVPLFIIILYKRKMEGPVGTIDTTNVGKVQNNEDDDDDDMLN